MNSPRPTLSPLRGDAAPYQFICATLAVLCAGFAFAQTPLTIVTSNLPPASEGVPYSAMLQATGGTKPYTWSVIGGALPGGLMLNPSTGGISGDPAVTVANPLLTAAGPVTGSGLTFQVMDSTGATASASLPISVAPPVTIQTGNTPAGTVSSPYTYCVFAQGGDVNSGWSWSIASGSLPPGVNLVPGGGGKCPLVPGSQVVAIAGTPSQAGGYSFELQVTDPDGRTAEQGYSLQIFGAGASPGLSLTLTPSSLSLTAAPASLVTQMVQVTLASGSLGFTASVTQGADWLSVSPTGGTTPATLVVTVKASNLSTGTHTGTIQVVASGASNSPQTVTVTVSVASPPVVTSVVSAASYATGAFAPGTLITIKGSGLGPSSGVAGANATNDGPQLGGTEVLINGTPAPMLYSSAGQVNAILPFTEAGQSSVSLQVSYNGATSAPVTLPLAPASPAVFTESSSGTGQGAILNQDYSVNSSTNPAAAGSAVMVYGSGAGQYQPPIQDGVLTGANVSTVVLPVTAQVDGVTAQVLYAGTAPGIVAGVMQVNVMIPSGTRSGNVPITISVNGVASQNGVTVAVR